MLIEEHAKRQVNKNWRNFEMFFSVFSREHGAKRLQLTKFTTTVRYLISRYVINQSNHTMISRGFIMKFNIIINIPCVIHEEQPRLFGLCAFALFTVRWANSYQPHVRQFIPKVWTQLGEFS